MRNLIDGLPEDARLQSDTPDEPWGVTRELLAMLVEEVSITNSERRHKQPLEIPRPGMRAAEVVDDEAAAEKHGAIPALKHGGMLAAAVAAGRAIVSTTNG